MLLVGWKSKTLCYSVLVPRSRRHVKGPLERITSGCLLSWCLPLWDCPWILKPLPITLSWLHGSVGILVMLSALCGRVLNLCPGPKSLRLDLQWIFPIRLTRRLSMQCCGNSVSKVPRKLCRTSGSRPWVVEVNKPNPAVWLAGMPLSNEGATKMSSPPFMDFHRCMPSGSSSCGVCRTT